MTLLCQICSLNKCSSISKVDQTKMTKLKNFHHNWLFNPNLSHCPDRDIYIEIESQCYVDNEGMFGALSNHIMVCIHNQNRMEQKIECQI